MEDSHLERIERFLSGEMEEKDRQQFEKQLNEDEELQSELSAYIMANEVIELDVHNHLKEKMNQWDLPEKKGSVSARTVTMIILILLAIAVASIIWVCPAQTEKWDQFAVVNLEGIQRSTSEQEDIRRLNQYYLSENYEQAEQMIERMDPQRKNTPEVEFVDALLAYQDENFAKAAESFALLKENESAGFIVQDQSEYFYFLTLVRMGECKPDCQTEIREMSQDPNHLRQSEAAELINYLSN